MNRIGWIDSLRGLSMMLILVFHTEVYYKEYNYTPYYIYTTNAIILFYFISGYLFYRPESFSLKKKLNAIARSLLFPYFIFTSLIAVPKLLVRQEAINLQEIVINILTGRASWFIAALIVGELFFALLLTKTRGKIIWLLTDAIACLIIYYVIPFNQHNYWQWQDALLSVTFLSAGYIYHQYDNHFNIINKPLYSSILLLILFLIKVYEYDVNLPMRNIAVENALLFLIDAIIWLLFIISIIKYIPHCRLVEWIGKHCIVYYFLCGGVPLTVSLLLNKIGFSYDGYLYRFLMALIIVYIIITSLTWFVYRYIPFITGKRIKLIFLSMICYSFSNAQTTLPIINLSGEFGYDYQEGYVSLIYPDGTSQNNLTAKIKWRGGTTNAEGKHKCNYKIKFTEEYSFFGMRNDNNWILDAGQADLFRLRNRIATELWNDFATKPYYINQEPNALSGVRGQVVEVYLNNEYRGIYSLTECMDRKQLKLKKFDKKTGEIHGGLWKSESYGSSLMWECPDNYDNKSETWDAFEVKYPELDDLPETDYSTLWNAINFVVNSSDEDFTQHVAEYFDIPVIIDYYVFLHTLNAFDNVGKNMYWAVYDKAEDKKITPAVWDLDATVGAKWLGDWAVPDYEMNINLNLIVRLSNLNVDNFNEKANNRYHELKRSFLSTDNLIKRYQDYYNLIKLSGAAQREEEKWSGDSDINGEEINFDNEIAYISDWISKHMKYLDSYIFPHDTKIRNISIAYKDRKIYNLQGQSVNSNYKGLCIRDGKKIIMR